MSQQPSNPPFDPGDADAFDAEFLNALNDPDDDLAAGEGFRRYFLLEEAAAMLPQVARNIEAAQEEFAVAKDEIILFKRLLAIQKRAGKKPTGDQVEHLKTLYHAAEAVAARWGAFFDEQGILLRDIEQGLIDFPYHAKTRDEDFFLCWKQGEDGLFYFHPVETGIRGRQPITLLPD